MTKEEFTREYKIKIYAHRWWNFDEEVPAGYRLDVIKYISEHPEEFKGAGPQ